MRRVRLETGRLVLRPWRESDAEALFAYASDPAVGPAAGWRPHESVEESRGIIRDVLAVDETYALVVRGRAPADEAVGSVSLRGADASDFAAGGEFELGFWLARPLWGRGYMTEAAGELVRHAFEDLGAPVVWCGHYEGNDRSRRVQEKLGFVPHHVARDRLREHLGDRADEHVQRLTRTRWETTRRRGGVAG